MEKEDLRHFSRDEIIEIFTELINRMETQGVRYMNEYEKDNENLEMYTCASGLLTNVNWIRNKLIVKKSKGEIKEIPNKTILIDFFKFHNDSQNLKFTQFGIERIVDSFLEKQIND
jgi:hypothetical protein